MVERVPDLMRRAFSKLRSGRPGPVLLEIPQDVAEAEFPEELFNYEPPRSVRQQADPADVGRAAAALLGAERPLIHAGQGVLYAEATDELIELAEFLQAPVMTMRASYCDSVANTCGSSKDSAVASTVAISAN